VGIQISQREQFLFRGDRSWLNHRAVYAANRLAGRHHVPGPYSGPVILCLTRDRRLRGARNYRLDWLDLVPQAGPPVFVASRNSGDMLNVPHVYELTDGINGWLSQAHAVEEDARQEAVLRLPLPEAARRARARGVVWVWRVVLL